jgi:hypothetical protein
MFLLSKDLILIFLILKLHVFLGNRVYLLCVVYVLLLIIFQ